MVIGVALTLLLASKILWSVPGERAADLHMTLRRNSR